MAQEVRGLAQRSAEEIKALISTSRGQVEQGVGLVGRTGEALGRIVDQIASITSLVADIDRSAQEQAVSLAEVNTAIHQMDQVVQRNAAMVEEATAATHSMKGDAGTLSTLVGRFQTGAVPAKAAPRSLFRRLAKDGFGGHRVQRGEQPAGPPPISTMSASGSVAKAVSPGGRLRV